MHIIINLKCTNLIFGGIVTELCLALEDCIVCVHVYMYMYMYTFSDVQYTCMYMLMIVSVKFLLIAF